MPLIAVLAPIGASIALWVITRSAMALVFAGLGPVIAIATTVDARLHRRRARRDESRRFASDCDVVHADIERSLDAIRRSAEHEHPPCSIRAENLERDPTRWTTRFEARLPVRLGTATIRSGLEVEQAPADSRDPIARDAFARLRTAAGLLPGAPLVVEPGAGIGFAGPEALVTAAARAVLMQVAVRCSPQQVTLEGATGWMTDLPHVHAVAAAHPTFRSLDAATSSRQHALVVATAATPAGLPRELGVVVVFDAAGRAEVVRGGGSLPPIDPAIDYLGLEAATHAAARLATAARAEGIARDDALPERVSFGEIAAVAASTTGERGLRCALGIGHTAVVDVDLARDGPHAVVGGTTGSGKSELLLSWILGMAGGRSPDQVTFLFVDFKGGAAFEPLARLPHCVGVITDLDPAESLRALGSLAAELRFRERALAEAGLRSIDDAQVGAMPFPRLVVVVDEYATLVERQQELHTVFSDIAARGRSLGVHLILCTQRPAGVVRDSILANCALRVSLRVHNPADSVAVVGTDAAALLPARPLGRAVISRGGQAPELLQVARSDSSDVDAVAVATVGARTPRAPWLPPLAASIPLPTTSTSRGPGGSPSADGIPIGMVDRPEAQVQEVISWRPREHGSLFVTGAGRSGKSGVLAAIEAGHGDFHCSWIQPGIAALWDALTDALAEGAAAPTGYRGRALLIDDIDITLAACPQDYQPELLDLMGRVLREGPALGVWPVVTAQRASGGLHTLAALCGSAMVMRMSSRAEHVAAGGESGHYDPALPPGGARWLGARIQVFSVGNQSVAAAGRQANSPVTVARSRHAGARSECIAPPRPVVVVSTAPARFSRVLAATRPHSRITLLTARRPGDDPPALVVDNGDVVAGDPQLWQAHWTLLAEALRSSTVLFDGCSLADLRAVTGRRELPPPFDRGERPLWALSPGGDYQRARLGP